MYGGAPRLPSVNVVYKYSLVGAIPIASLKHCMIQKEKLIGVCELLLLPVAH